MTKLGLILAAKFLCKIFPCEAIGDLDNFLGCSISHQSTAIFSSIWAYIDDMIRRFDDIHVVFHNQNGVSTFYECIKGMQ